MQGQTKNYKRVNKTMQATEQRNKYKEPATMKKEASEGGASEGGASEGGASKAGGKNHSLNRRNN